eukprot:TRINITY_DN6850_c0_g1_i4.p1 TRINITY_DN6850_c0_g1~~TRINITY_DN6850_c0_g1_i4.p1  ORF type:complete len:172 (-),score=46.41 TRINITY_DN6850_c0_g1_i4:157-672(-)
METEKGRKGRTRRKGSIGLPSGVGVRVGRLGLGQSQKRKKGTGAVENLGEKWSWNEGLSEAEGNGGTQPRGMGMGTRLWWSMWTWLTAEGSWKRQLTATQRSVEARGSSSCCSSFFVIFVVVISVVMVAVIPVLCGINAEYGDDGHHHHRNDDDEDDEKRRTARRRPSGFN